MKTELKNEFGVVYLVKAIAGSLAAGAKLGELSNAWLLKQVDRKQGFLARLISQPIRDVIGLATIGTYPLQMLPALVETKISAVQRWTAQVHQKA